MELSGAQRRRATERSKWQTSGAIVDRTELAACNTLASTQVVISKALSLYASSGVLNGGSGERGSGRVSSGPGRPGRGRGLGRVWRRRERSLTAVRAAGSWKSYVRTPHKSLLRLRSLLARGRARRRPLWAQPTPHALVRLFDPSLPNGVFWHVLSYWRETG